MYSSSSRLQILELPAIAGYKPNSICVSIIDNTIEDGSLPKLSNIIAQKIDLNEVERGKQYVVQATDGHVRVKMVSNVDCYGLTLSSLNPDIDISDNLFIHTVLIKAVYRIYRVEIDKGLDH